MKKLAFTVLYAFCLTIMGAGITFAATEEQETAVDKDVVAVQKEQAVEQEDAVKKDMKKDDEECRKLLHKKVRDAVDETEKERCQ